MLSFFRSLAPLRLLNYRTYRFRGDSLSITLDQLVSADRGRLQSIYNFLCALCTRLDTLNVQRDVELEPITTEELLTGIHFDEARENLRLLGTATPKAEPHGTLELSLHDARGGSLSALTTLLSWLRQNQTVDPRPHLRSLYYYTRDQLKILRNAFADLDTPARADDLEFKLHDVRTIVTKLKVASRIRNGKRARLSVRQHFEGAIATCCCESAALDRVLHNCLDNAYRHTADNRVEFTFFPIPDAEGPNLRLVISNRINSEDHAALSEYEHRHGNLDALFQPGVSAGTSGLGLAIVANFITDAYGIRSPEEAIRERYVGAVRRDDKFHVWLHWPIANAEAIAAQRL